MKSSASELISRALVNAYWHPLCMRNQISADKDYVRFNVLDFEVVVFNDKGNLIAFDNRCPHRGTRFFIEDQGNQRIICPYHGWSFASGTLRVPNAKSFEGCDIGKANLNFFELSVCGDLVFFSVTPETSLKAQLGEDIFTLLEKITTGLDKCADFNRYGFESDWPISLENALEPYHIPMVHRDTLATLKLGVGHNYFSGQNSIWYAPVENEKVERRLTSLNKYFSVDEPYQGYMSIFIYPFSMLSSTFGYSYSMQNFFPALRDDLTYFTSQLYPAPLTNERYSEIASAFITSTAAVNRQVFEEDHSICKRVPADTWSWQPPRYVNVLEEKLLHFRASCAERAALLGLTQEVS